MGRGRHSWGVNPHLVNRPWVPAASEALVQKFAAATAVAETGSTYDRLMELVDTNRQIHIVDCLNLNPATNVMNPRAEAVLAGGLGSRPSLGYPGAKYEMGLEAIEEIEVIAAELAAEVFRAAYAEIRVPSGAIANLYSFMAFAEPGDVVIVPPASIGGHVTHHRDGAAGLYRLDIREAPIDAANYTIDVDGLATMAREVRPKVITIGQSLNLRHHPVAVVREIADDVGAKLMFDAAHLSGPIAGGAWPDPLTDGAHVMTMSTYKSLGGPPSGLVVTNDAETAERLDAIAYPGLTANFDAAKSASLAITLLDWKEFGESYAAEMVACAGELATVLTDHGVPVYGGGTESHAFAIDATEWGGGHAAALQLRQANLLACAIGLPIGLNAGLRIGTNELVRWGMSTADMPEIAALIVRALDDPAGALSDVTSMRIRFDELHYVIR